MNLLTRAWSAFYYILVVIVVYTFDILFFYVVVNCKKGLMKKMIPITPTPTPTSPQSSGVLYRHSILVYPFDADAVLTMFGGLMVLASTTFSGTSLNIDNLH